jgi:tetratricopeptide (TPR) repeat protein
MRISSFAIAAALALVVALAPRTAHADDPLKPAAKVRFDAGVKLTSAARYDDAIREFQAAYEIDPNPVLFYSLAVAERLAGRCPAAVDYYERFLRSGPSRQRTEAARAGIEMCSGARGSGPSWYRNPIVGVIAGGVVGMVFGAGFLIAADGTRDRAALAQHSDDFEATLDRATVQRRTGAVLLVLGAALVGGGVAYHVKVQRRRQPTIAIAHGARSIFLARSF